MASISTTSSDTATKLFDWMRKCHTMHLNNISFGFGDCGYLGCYAAKKLSIGDVVVRIPRVCIVGYEHASTMEIANKLRSFLLKCPNPDHKVTAEFLIWIDMIAIFNDKSSFHYPYVTSLNESSPSLYDFPSDLLGTIVETNLGQSLELSKKAMLHYLTLLNNFRNWETSVNEDSKSCVPSSIYNMKSLVWARGHYLSRRYPGRCAPAVTEMRDEQEPGMGGLGAMIPILDLCNHSPDEEWLTLQVDDKYLNVMCNYPRNKGEEIYFNYGALSNERLLYGYGFALSSNTDEAVAVKLSGRFQSSAASSSHFGTFFVQSGGLAGVPKGLWRALTVMIDHDHNHNEAEDSNDLNTRITDNDNDQSKLADDANKSDEEDSNKDCDDDCEKDEDREEESMEIGFEEAEVLLSWVTGKLRALENTQSQADEVFARYHVLPAFCPSVSASTTTSTSSVASRKRSAGVMSDQVGDNSSAVNEVAHSDMHPPVMQDMRAVYLQWYRDGQMKILRDLLTELSEIIDSTSEEEKSDD